MVHRLPLEESLSAVPRLNKKDFRRQGRISILFLSSNSFLHCRGPIFSLFYLFCFPTRVKRVFVMFSHKVNAGTSCWDCGVVGSQPFKGEFCPLTRLKCNPVSDQGVFYPSPALHSYLRYLSHCWFLYTVDNVLLWAFSWCFSIAVLLAWMVQQCNVMYCLFFFSTYLLWI